MAMQGHIVVAGLGKTGTSVVRYLLARGHEVCATDTRRDPPGLAVLRAIAPGLRAVAGHLDTGLLAGAASVVASPGMSLADPFFEAARRLGVPVLGDIELFARSGAGPVAGITGTNGKSTVTTLVGQMALAAGVDARMGGNLGTPALDLLEGARAGLYVLELSSYQLECTQSLVLAAATVLNITPDHLDRYAGAAAYAAAKARIFAHARAAVVNLDDPVVREMARDVPERIGFSLQGHAGADYTLLPRDGDEWLCAHGEALLPVRELKVAGRHNLANALAALAMGEALGLARAPMLAALRDFRGLAHRMQWVADVGGVRYINDSKGTNVGATLAAVAGLAGPLVLIAGGDGKQQDFTPLRAALAGKAHYVVLIGRDADAIAAALRGACPLQHCASLEGAVVAAAAVARPGDTVLLSPACASLDMFRDYAQRGEVFAGAVGRLAA